MFWRKAQRERNWYLKYGAQADAHAQNDGSYRVDRVRNFTYTRNGAETQAWIDNVPIVPSAVVRAWYLLEPFTSWSAVAHPYFIFEYADGSCICLTIEGKRLDGHPYSGINGVLNEYELGYIWITEQDCLSMPLAAGAQALYLYPLALSPTEAGRLCKEFLNDTHALFETPQFYNTLFNNCTALFAKALQRVGRTMPHDKSWYLPGYSDTYLMKLGLIQNHKTILDARRTSDLMLIQDRVWQVLNNTEKNPMKKVFELVAPVGIEPTSTA